MRKYLPILLSLFIVFSSAWIVIFKVKNHKNVTLKEIEAIGSLTSQESCRQLPHFLNKLKIPQPIAIDLSQQHYKGLAFLYGKRMSQAVHLKTWEKFDHFSSYTLDPKGNMYLTPMPYISIKNKTFEFQKNIYKLDTDSGNLSVWMVLEDVDAGANNPYGIISIDYDCKDNSLWVSAIDETDYFHSKGVIYHIDIDSKKILQKMKGFDALSIKLLQTTEGKHLLVASARENNLYAYKIENQKLLSTPIFILKLPDANEHIRKMILLSQNRLKIQSIPFSYSLVAQTQEGSIRKDYLIEVDNFTKKLCFITEYR